jgi:hypothetical protein
VRYIAQSYSGVIGFGDIVQTNSSGYIIPVTGTGQTTALGVFQGCEYYDSSRQVWTFNQQWPGGITTPGAVKAYISMDPNTVYTVQVSGGPVTNAIVGQNIDISYTAPNSTTGLSQVAVAYSTAGTAQKLLRVVAISNRFFPGYDPVLTNQDNGSTFPTNCYVDVVLNQSEFNYLTGI